MSQETVLICDRCGEVIRNVTKYKDAKSDLVVHVRSDITVLTSAFDIAKPDECTEASEFQNKIEASCFVDLCDSCRDECADLLSAIFTRST